MESRRKTKKKNAAYIKFSEFKFMRIASIQHTRHGGDRTVIWEWILGPRLCELTRIFFVCHQSSASVLSHGLLL